jgi:hypothetical protein
MIHWWFKNKFIECGDRIIIHGQDKTYICSEVIVEQSIHTSHGIYRPDITIKTKCSEIIYFEMNYRNKKKTEDYIDKWLELKKTVVEVDIKDLLLGNEASSFTPLFSNGKIINSKKNDTYYNTIGKYKEIVLYDFVTDEQKKRIEKLDWLWREITNYKLGTISIDRISLIIDSIDQEGRGVVDEVLKSAKCSKLYKDYKNYKKQFEELQLDFTPEDLTNKVSFVNENQCINPYELKLVSTKKYKSESYYNGSRKHMYKTRQYFSHYTFSVVLKCKEKIINRISVLNKDYEKLVNTNFLTEWTIQITKNHKIGNRCVECNKVFNMEFKELKYYSDKNFKIPKRCPVCKSKRKNNQDRRTSIIE